MLRLNSLYSMFPPLKLVTLKRGCLYTMRRDAFAFHRNCVTFAGLPPFRERQRRKMPPAMPVKPPGLQIYAFFNWLRSMYGVNRDNVPYPNTSTYSPVTLNNEWPVVERLLLMVTLSTIGTILNVFFVASFFVEPTLRRPGLVFLACIGLTDMIVTGAIMSTSSMILLSGEWDNVYVCSILHWFGVSVVYCYSLFFMFVAVEDYLRICCSKRAYKIVTASNVALIASMIYMTSFMVGAIGVYLGFDYDYCLRTYQGNIHFRAATLVTFYILPCFLTIYCLISSYVHICRRATSQLSYKRSLGYDRDNSIASLNILVYVIFILTWLPYLIISINIYSASDAKYYNSIWFGQGRTVLTSFLYSLLDRNFRRAFGNLFNYCFCKSSLSSPLAPRNRRAYSTRVRLLQPNMFRARSSQIAVRGRTVYLTRETRAL